MLPFLKPKTVAGLIIKHRVSDGNIHEEREDKQDQGLEAACEDILMAISAKDAEHLANALRAAFDILDSEPHVEGPHVDNEQDEEE